jgi:ADP-ribose pyrophosphatase YjhB (NUDIX family)
MSAEDNKELSLRYAVRTIILNSNLQVLLVKRAEGVFEGGRWCLPGGVLEEYEDPKTGASRENIEEMGFASRLLPYDTIENPDTSTGEKWVTHYYVSHSSALPTQLKKDEISEVDFFDLEQLHELDVAFDHKKVITDLLVKI